MAYASSWIFVLNNPTDADKLRIRTMVTTLSGGLVYGVFQLEHARPEDLAAGLTPHLQGYLDYGTKRKLMGFLKNPERLGARAHVEPRTGSRKSNVDYCKKAGGLEQCEAGICPPDKGQGHRSDLEAAAAELANGASMRDVATQWPGQFIRYHGGMEAYQSLVCARADRPKPVVIYLGGPTAMGKTTFAVKVAKARGEWCMQIDGEQWWPESIRNAKTLIIDECTCAYPLQFYNSLLSEFPCTVNIKYARPAHVMAGLIFILSNKRPFEHTNRQWVTDPAMYATFDRRLHHTFWIDQQYDFHEVEQCIPAENGIPDDEPAAGVPAMGPVGGGGRGAVDDGGSGAGGPDSEMGDGGRSRSVTPDWDLGAQSQSGSFSP